MSFTWRPGAPRAVSPRPPAGGSPAADSVQAPLSGEGVGGGGRRLSAVALRRWASAPLLATWSLVLVYTLFFGMLTVQRHAAFLTSAFDLGNYDQALWNTAHGRPFELSNIPGVTTRLAHHVEPILLLIAPLYWLWSDPRLLLWLQSAVIALGAVPLFWFARRQVGAWPAVALAAAYLLSPALQGANLFDFHAVALAPTFLLLALNWLDERRDGLFLAAALLAVSTKEEIGLIVAMMGLYALLIQRRRFGWLPLVLGAGWSALAIGVILPHFNPAGQPEHVGRYAELGEGLGGVIGTLVTRPGVLLAVLAEPSRLGYLAGLLLPLAGLPLLAPEILLLGAPSLAVNLLSNYEPMQTLVGFHYPAPIIPFTVAAAAVGLRRLVGSRLQGGRLQGGRLQGGRLKVGRLKVGRLKVGRLKGGRLKVGRLKGGRLQGGRLQVGRLKVGRLQGGGLEDLRGFTLPGSAPYRGGYTTFNLQPANLPTLSLATLLVLLATLIAQVRSGATPLAAGFAWPAVTEHHRTGQALIATIPPGAAVSAGWRINPHVSQRARVYQFPDVRDAELVLLDVTMLDLFMHPNDLRERVETLLAEGWGVDAATGGWLLLRRAAGQTRVPHSLPAEFYSFARLDTLPPPQFAMQADFGDAVRLLGYDFAHTGDGPRLTLYWTALRSPDGEVSSLRLWPLFLDPYDGHVLEDASLRPLIETLWYPPERWQPGEIVRTTTTPWQFGEDYTVALGVRAGGDTVWLPPRIVLSDVVPELVHAGNAVKLLDVRAGRAVPKRRVQAPPAGLTPRPASVGPLTLLGYALDRRHVAPGASLQVALAWQAGPSVPAANYTVFVQLLSPDGRLVAQSDGQPVDATRPTSGWAPGEVVLDRHTLVLPNGLPAGEYRLIAGLYDLNRGGARLRVMLDGNRIHDDAVPLRTIGVEAR